MDTILSAQDFLMRYGIRPSVQRIAIMSYLMEHRNHPTVEDIYCVLSKQMPTLSRTTIYNTVKLFAERGSLQVLGIDDKNVRYDIDTSPHAHFICQGCGKVYDITLVCPEGILLQGAEEFVIKETHLYCKGYCNSCSSRKKSK